MASVASVPAYLLPGIPAAHPPHLEGDATLATEILPGPPLLNTVKQAAFKRPTAVSYIPTSDPGSTYTGWAPPAIVIAPVEGDEPRRKRVRADSGRAFQPPSFTSILTAPAALSTQEDEVKASTSHGAYTLMTMAEADSVSANGELAIVTEDSDHHLGKRPQRNKSKGKEKMIMAKVKDEPVQMSFSAFDTPRMANEDHCSSCRTAASGGGLIYCDSCPRAFHFICLNPPKTPEDMLDGDWHCPSCTTAKALPGRSDRGLFGPLLQTITSMHPTEFQLPEDVRTFFKDVATDSRGFYLDSSRIRHGRLDRHGLPEERDPYKLRSRDGLPVVCFHCGQSSISNIPNSQPADALHTHSKRPSRLVTLKPNVADSGRLLASCDYCELHWHLDCMDPPLSSLPSFGSKWMCPAHADHAMPKRRAPRLNNPPIDVNRPGQIYNGNLEIIDSSSSTPMTQRIDTDEVVINGRRYRIPERIVVLDFSSRLSRDKLQAFGDAVSSDSSLSTLSTEDDEDLSNVTGEHRCTASDTDMRLAQMLCEMQAGVLQRKKIQREQHGAKDRKIVSKQTAADGLVSAGLESAPDQPALQTPMSNNTTDARPKRDRRPATKAIASTTQAKQSLREPITPSARPARTSRSSSRIVKTEATSPKLTFSSLSISNGCQTAAGASVVPPALSTPEQPKLQVNPSSLKIRLPARNTERNQIPLSQASLSLPIPANGSAKVSSRPRRSTREAAPPSTSSTSTTIKSNRPRRKATKSVRLNDE